MYIKSIVLDGFKSYAHRTEVKHFDPQFNAITGLNGSGKSNILDSICFVLGITNLAHVRATNLQDLIYKSGQTGVTKATVSITFDNKNKDHCPPGFEQFDEITISRQIVIGGKNKYLINGLTVTNKRVQDFFCSVHLNVNNPHFLVMQGKITKVLNMKPPEILGMIEEAAGTKIYETKRQVLVRAMERKNAKLAEFDEMFKHDIEPRLQRLREQRSQYFEFQRIERDVERLTLLCYAWEYFKMEQLVDIREKDVIAIENQIEQMKIKIKENLAAAEEIEAEVKSKMDEYKKAAGGKLEEIETDLQAKQKKAAELNASEKAAKENVNVEERKIKQLQKSLKDDEAALQKKDQELSKVQNVFETLKTNEAADNEALAHCQKKFEAISAGMEVNESGEAQTLKEQLIAAKEQSKEADTNLKVFTMDLDNYRKQLKAKQDSLGGATADYKKDKADLENMEKEEKSLQNSISKLNYSEERMSELQRKRQMLTTGISDHRDNVDNFHASKPYLQFNYTDPEPHFNRSSVFGVVCNLIKVKDRAYCTAIETAAGGKLYNVVVDKDITSKKLLERGNLQTRTTFIPLNKIQGGKIPDRTVEFAQNLVGPDNLIPALDVLTYDKKLQTAMEFIFGNVFIAKNLGVAKNISYHESIRKRCVTFDGDVTDPSGTLSGGARQKNTPLLLLLEDIRKDEEAVKQKERELASIQPEYRTLSSLQEKYFNCKNQLDLLRHQSQMLRTRLQQGAFYKQQEEIETLKSSIAELEQGIATCKSKQAESSKKVKELESKMKNAKNHLANQQKETEAELARLQKNAEKSRQAWLQREEEHRTLNMEITELKNTIQATQEQIEKAQETVSALNEKLAEAKEESTKIKEIISQVQADIKTEKAAITEKNKQIQKISKQKEEKLQENMNIQLELKKMQHDLTNAQQEYKIAKSDLAHSNKDIKKVSEKHMNEAKTLSAADGQRMQKKLQDSKAKMADLKTRVNPKAQKMYEHEEKLFGTAQKKIDSLMSDKKRIIQSIESLDRQKTQAITLAFNQVTKDLGSILGTLLPGANARLKVPQGHTILTGVEINVSLGGVWKESLGELSGGQRSLVALSFILAMLLFNPAPLYILDEVDAALDMSHTQNIGAMLKQHFKQSQFIIVSLKDGMFNNANVLFKTQFIDGMSNISRTTNKANK